MFNRSVAQIHNQPKINITPYKSLMVQPYKYMDNSY